MLDGPYEPKSIDRAAQDLWERLGVHRFDPASKAEVFSIDTPPPTVSGNLHIGHVFSYTQAECIARYQRMRGKNVFYPFGYDGNGLPTERLAEQEHGVKGKDMPRPDFVRLCLETSKKYAAAFEVFMRSLGLSADWSLAYSTIDERSMRVSQRGFLDLWTKGHAYLKESPTLWCTQCGTALAQADLEFKDKPSQFTTLRFDLEGGGHLEIATTRPELLPACVAVFVHPGDARAKALVGRRALVPLQDGRAVPVLADEKVDPEKGTGVVMCCTFGDKTDVEWFQKHGLPLRQALAKDGTMTDLAGPEKGLYVNKARRGVLERLQAAGHVTATKEIVHPVAAHERCKTDIQFLPTKQVFVRLLDKKADLIAQGEKVRWLPDFMGKRYRNWVENLEWDWCISRQRFYGVPFPFWHCKGCGGLLLARDQDLPVDPTARAPHAPCPGCGGTDFDPERDVMDTWATSSETPQINARWGEKSEGPRSPRPMSMRPQAHEIIRTWAFYTIAKSWLHFRDVPWRDAMISGLVLASDREKISKSKGNAPLDPRDLLDKHGADAVRYWALSGKLGTDYPYSDEDLASGRRLGVKLWNAARLAATHLTDFDPKAPPASPQVIDRWMRARLAAGTKAVTDDLDAYEFGTAKGKVEQLFWNDLCDNYLEMLKARLHDARPEAAGARRAAQAGLYDALSTIVRLLAPFVPHVAEAVWQALFATREGAPSVTRAPWPTADAGKADSDAEAAGAAALTLLTHVRRWRSENKVSPGVPLAEVVIRVGTDLERSSRTVLDDVRAAARIACLEVQADPALGEEPVLVRVVPAPAAPKA
jgi:valyl-tRNA synthetase